MEYQANNGHGRSNVAVYGMLLSICLVMGYLENLIPIAVPVPGIKPGFSNIVEWGSWGVWKGDDFWAILFPERIRNVTGR